MTRHVYITEKHPKHGTRVLAYRCNDDQATWYESIARMLIAKGHSPAESQRAVDDLVLAFLVGKEPKANVHKSIRDGRRIFPALTTKEMRALPTVGCPPPPVEAFIMQVEVPGKGMATVRYDFDDGQQRMFEYAIDDLVSHGIDRNHAWFTVVQVVGKLLNGATLTSGADEITRCLALHFLPMETSDVASLPEASEEDVVRWSFTPRVDARGVDPESQGPEEETPMAELSETKVCKTCGKPEHVHGGVRHPFLPGGEIGKPQPDAKPEPAGGQDPAAAPEGGQVQAPEGDQTHDPAATPPAAPEGGQDPAGDTPPQDMAADAPPAGGDQGGQQGGEGGTPPAAGGEPPMEPF